MPEDIEKADTSAEKAYAAAAETVTQAKPAAVAEAAKPTPAPVTAKPAPAKPAPSPKIATKPVAKKPAPKAAAAKAPKAKKPVLARKTAKPAAPKPAAKAAKPAAPKSTSKTPLPKSKDIPMTKTPDFMKSMTETMADAQTRMKAAYDKSTTLAGEATEFAKGNVEAMVEAGKIFGAGMQKFGKSYVEQAKGAYETMTADMKEMVAVKSPTELFQLQGKLARRNFDSMVAFSSKSSEAMVKLANDSMAPLSSRMSVAADTLSKVA